MKDFHDSFDNILMPYTSLNQMIESLEYLLLTHNCHQIRGLDQVCMLELYGMHVGYVRIKAYHEGICS